MTEPRIRRATAADLPALVTMLADDALGRTREDASLPVVQCYVDAFDAIELDPNQSLAVVEMDGQCVGCLQLSFIPGLSRLGMWRGQIESVRIAASHRGHGLGGQMIRWAIAQSRERGCGLVQLTTDKSRADAKTFYESLGFESTHDGMKLALHH
ncbi:MAG: GNAT family N-acetyltransferase [Gammaproteobacteria bacterium]